MAISQKRSIRKPSGGRYKTIKGKQKCYLGRISTNTKLDNNVLITPIKTRGGNCKVRVELTNFANVLDKKTKKYEKVKIKTVTETPANRNYARRNIVVKGAIIETEKGKAVVTSRPGQDGTVNAVLLNQ